MHADAHARDSELSSYRLARSFLSSFQNRCTNLRAIHAANHLSGDLHHLPECSARATSDFTLSLPALTNFPQRVIPLSPKFPSAQMPGVTKLPDSLARHIENAGNLSREEQTFLLAAEPQKLRE